MHRQFIDRVLDISVAHREGTHSANCAEDRDCGRRPCDQQQQVPAVQRFESKVPQIQSILRVADIPVVQQKPVEILQVQFLVVWEVVDMPENVQRQVPRLWTNFLIFHVKVDSDPEAASMAMSSIWHSLCASVHVLLEQFQNFFVKVGIHAQVRTGHPDIFPSSMAVFMAAWCHR